MRESESPMAGGLPGGVGDAAGRRSGWRRWAADDPGVERTAPLSQPGLRLEIRTRVRDGEWWLPWLVAPIGFEWVRMVRTVLSGMRWNR